MSDDLMPRDEAKIAEAERAILAAVDEWMLASKLANGYLSDQSEAAYLGEIVRCHCYLRAARGGDRYSQWPGLAAAERRKKGGYGG